MGVHSNFNTYSVNQKVNNSENIFSIDYEPKSINAVDREAEVLSKINEIADCESQETLMEIVKNDQNDIRVRLVAADKITDEVFLNYLLVSINLRHTIDNLKITLFLAQKATDEEIVNNAMWDILSNSHFYPYAEADEIFEKAISYTTSVEILEKFINNSKYQKLIDLAYSRAMELLEKG